MYFSIQKSVTQFSTSSERLRFVFPARANFCLIFVLTAFCLSILQWHIPRVCSLLSHYSTMRGMNVFLLLHQLAPEDRITNFQSKQIAAGAKEDTEKINSESHPRGNFHFNLLLCVLYIFRVRAYNYFLNTCNLSD